MKRISILFLCMLNFAFGQKFLTPFEKGNGNQSPDYNEMVKYFDELDQKYETILVKKMGLTDSGEPLRVVFFSPEKDFQNFKNRSVILINNGIHPGEPDGIDASMMMLRDFAEGKLTAPKNVIIAVIECYNIGGMLNRGSFSRANQNGPEEYGFRGNARNYDLNRDFIKTDSRNSASFQEIYQWLKPDVFIDNHVSDGADYQYVLTYILTNRQRLGKLLGDFYFDEMNPWLIKDLRKKNIDPIPYVELEGKTPEKGYEQFMDSPRYSTGYTTLFNTIGTVPETHMLKPYKDRVKATYENMLSYISYLDANVQKIKILRKENLKQYQPKMKYGIRWEIDSTKYKMMDFRGFEHGYKSSDISGKDRLFYDRSKPYTKKIPYYDTYKSTKEITIPSYYVIPQSEWKVLEFLKRNQIEMKTLKSDSTIAVESYKIADYKTSQRSYEGHYIHFNTNVSAVSVQKKFRKGDMLVSLKQDGAKYLLETLEPEAVDSFFNWNFFDGILGQKEYYSAYVFEDTAAKLMKEDPDLKARFEKKKSEDKKFTEDGDAQLDWVYRNSKYFEPSFQQYPVYRIL